MRQTIQTGSNRCTSLLNLSKKLAKKLGIIAGSTLICLSKVWAQESTSPAHPVSLDSISKLLLALILVLGVIFLAAWLMKRLNLLMAFKNPYFHVQASHSLGARERVVLMTVGDKQILLGVTANNVRTLHVFDEPIQVEVQAEPLGFAEKLAAVMQRANK